MKNLSTRFISALIAVLIFFVAYYFYSNLGVFLIGWAAVLVGCFEYMRLTLKPLAPPKILNFIYLCVCMTLFLLLIFFENTSLPAITLLIVYYIFCALWILAKSFEHQKLLNFVSLSLLGFFYSVFLPIFALKLLLLPMGTTWFLFLLCVVFAGDVMAYFGGVLFGKTKLMPSISPGKTLAGSVSGIAGSCITGFIFFKFSPLPLSVFQFILVTLCAGALAQTGDLFESLVKRVAFVKDSGQIMPGHGGSLDRFDGIYFAAPLIYLLATSIHNIN